jgi:hypothetical protein
MMWKLVHEISKVLELYLNVCSSSIEQCLSDSHRLQRMQHYTVEREFEDWRLDRLNACLDNIYINGLRPFSRGSWEAELSIS